jgi:hypothetical protein
MELKLENEYHIEPIYKSKIRNLCKTCRHSSDDLKWCVAYDGYPDARSRKECKLWEPKK